MYRVRRAASPSWSISHPSLTEEARASHRITSSRLLPGGLSLLHVPPALPFVIMVGCARAAVGTGGGHWLWGWLGASSTFLSGHGDGLRCWSQQHGGLDSHTHGHCPHHPWGCSLPCRHWEHGGHEEISVFVLGPASRLECLCAWWISPGLFHPSHLPQSHLGWGFLVLSSHEIHI